MLQNSVSLAKKNCKTNNKSTIYLRLHEEGKVAWYLGKVAFDDSEQLDFPLDVDAHGIYCSKREDYHSKLRDFLNHLEVDKIKTSVMLLTVMRKYFGNF